MNLTNTICAAISVQAGREGVRIPLDVLHRMAVAAAAAVEADDSDSSD